jgi:hypothetical protein
MSTYASEWLGNLFSAIQSAGSVRLFASMLTGITVLGVSSYYFIKLRREQLARQQRDERLQQ